MYGSSFDTSMDSFAYQYGRAGRGFPRVGSVTPISPSRGARPAQTNEEERLAALESGYASLHRHLATLQESIASQFSELKQAVLSRGMEHNGAYSTKSRVSVSGTEQERAMVSQLEEELRQVDARVGEQQAAMRNLKVFRHDAWAEGADAHGNRIASTPHRYNASTLQGSPPRGATNVSRRSSRGVGVSRRTSRAPRGDQLAVSNASLSQSVYGETDYSTTLNEYSPDVTRILERFSDSIDSVFHFYCFAVNPTKASHGMALEELSKLCRDCNLIRGAKLTIATVELVFHKAIENTGHGLDTHSSRAPGSRRGSLMSGGKELDRAGFGFVLTKLAEVVYGQHVEWPIGQKVEALLLQDILPYAQRRDPAKHSCPELDLPEVRAMFTQHRKDLVKIFKYWSRKGHTAKTTVSQTRFLELAKYYGLLPFIEKGDIRELYRHCARTPPASSHPGEKVDPHAAPELSYTEFCQLLATVGLRIYSSPLYSDTYPTPESRVRKLLVKLLVLTKPKEVDIRGNTT